MAHGWCKIDANKNKNNRLCQRSQVTLSGSSFSSSHSLSSADLRSFSFVSKAGGIHCNWQILLHHHPIMAVSCLSALSNAITARDQICTSAGHLGPQGGLPEAGGDAAVVPRARHQGGHRLRLQHRELQPRRGRGDRPAQPRQGQVHQTAGRGWQVERGEWDKCFVDLWNGWKAIKYKVGHFLFPPLIWENLHNLLTTINVMTHTIIGWVETVRCAKSNNEIYQILFITLHKKNCLVVGWGFRVMTSIFLGSIKYFSSLCSIFLAIYCRYQF